jgi:hypothetical protein
LFKGGNKYVPSGIFETIDLGKEGDGTWGQILDVASTGLPTDISSAPYVMQSNNTNVAFPK